jgi:hypothetical protein
MGKSGGSGRVNVHNPLTTQPLSKQEVAMAVTSIKALARRSAKRVYQVVGFLVVSLFLGCAGLPKEGESFRVSVTQLSLPELLLVCNRGELAPDRGLQGCYNWSGDTCRIYTLPDWVLDRRRDDGYHETLGHELHHCLSGDFHGGDKGVDLPRLPHL